MADPVVGMLITIAILWIVWDSARTVFTRLLDGVEPGVIDGIRRAAAGPPPGRRRAAAGVPGVREVSEVRARWIGHWLHAEVNVTVASEISVREGHRIAAEVRHRLFHQVGNLSNAIVHVDPLEASGEAHHRGLVCGSELPLS
jgi:divalent metal cation (Fe/Co/Zn/Cd) transporter